MIPQSFQLFPDDAIIISGAAGESTESYSDAGYPFAEEYFATRKALFNIKASA
jgi:hypothetical protein